MSKNKEMLKIFLEAFQRKNMELVLPKSYTKNIYSIQYEKLKSQGIKYLIYDIDNTILPVNEIKVSTELKKFFNQLKKDFTIILLSNNNECRVKPVAEELNVKSVANANKPDKIAYEKIKQEINIQECNTAMIGDQMLSDIVFGNKYNFYTILVEPYKKKYDIKTGTSRLLQNILMKKLKDKITRYHYY